MDHGLWLKDHLTWSLSHSLPLFFSFSYPAIFNTAMIHPLPNNEPYDIMCHHSVGNRDMRSGKNHAA